MIELPMRWPLVIQVTLLSLSFVWSVHLCCLRVLVSCSWYIHCVLLLIKIRGNWFIRDFFRSPNCWCLFICTQHPSESIQGKFLKKRLVDPQELQQSDCERLLCCFPLPSSPSWSFLSSLWTTRCIPKVPFVLYSFRFLFWRFTWNCFSTAVPLEKSSSDHWMS